MSTAFALYLLAVIADGDYLNDFLTWLPFWAAYPAQGAGMLLAILLGYSL